MRNLNLNGTAQSRSAFLNWFKTHEPRAYALVVQQANQLGDWTDTISNIFNKVTETVSKLAPTYIETKMQYDLLKLNIERAKQGLMPVNSLPTGYETGGAVAAQPAPASGIPSWAIPVGIGAILLLLLMRR